MSDKERSYQLYYGDLFDMYQECYDELKRKENRNMFEEGKLQAYWEILDSMKTRAELVHMAISEN